MREKKLLPRFAYDRLPHIITERPFKDHPDRWCRSRCKPCSGRGVVGVSARSLPDPRTPTTIAAIQARR